MGLQTKCKILNLMNTSRTSTVTTSPHFCSVLKPHRLTATWLGPLSLSVPINQTGLLHQNLPFCPMICPSEAGLVYPEWEFTGRITQLDWSGLTEAATHFLLGFTGVIFRVVIFTGVILSIPVCINTPGQTELWVHHFGKAASAGMWQEICFSQTTWLHQQLKEDFSGISSGI